MPCTRAGHQGLKRPLSLEKKGEKERIREETRRAGINRAEIYCCGGRGRGKSELGQPGRAAAPVYSLPLTVGSNGREERGGGGIDDCRAAGRAAPSNGPDLVPALRVVVGARARPAYRTGPGAMAVGPGRAFSCLAWADPLCPCHLATYSGDRCISGMISRRGRRSSAQRNLDS
jgi:hypothetical protein